MIDKHNALKNFSFDLPEPKPKVRTPPEGWKPFDDWKELSGVIALDLETNDPGIGAGLGPSWCREGEGKVCGFSIAHESQHFYAGVGHDGGNVDVDKAWRWLRAHAAKPDVTFVYSNCQYDLGWLLREEIAPTTLPVDVQGMAALLDEQRSSYSLDALLRDYLGRAKGTSGLLSKAREMGITNPYVNMHRMPSWIVDEYGIDDAKDTLELYHKFIPLLEAEDLVRVHELERECYLVGMDMRWRGVRVSLDNIATVKADFGRRRDSAIAIIKYITGVNVSPNDNHSIGRALVAENPELVMERTSTGVPVVQAAQIEAMQTPVSREVRTMRKMDKAIGTFCTNYIEKFAHKGRIHAEFHPLRKSREDKEGGGLSGAGPGRWSSSLPNLQNVPRRDADIGPAIRSCFLPEEGEEWLKADYSSQEPRMSAHFASLARGSVDRRGRWHVPTEAWHDRRPLPGAAELVEKYNADPTMSFHKEVGKAMGLGTRGALYDNIKRLNLALIYGMSGLAFARDLGLPTKWITKDWGDRAEVEVAADYAQDLLDKHAAAVPWGRPLAQLAKEAAEIRGYTKTILGRRIRYRKRYADGNLMDVHKALNNSVQGSAADQMKMALVEMRRAGIPVLVVVHDEGDFSKPLGEAGERMKARIGEIMANAVKLAVPSLAEMKVGKTWGDVG